MNGLVVRDVAVSAGERRIVAGASFAAPSGSVTGVIGPNGAGKSTLLGAVLGLRRLAAGTVTFEGADLGAMTAAARAKICAAVEQFASTTERLTVGDVVALGRLPFQGTWQTSASAEDAAMIAQAVAETGISALLPRLYHTLSGGEQQRVQIARALAQTPSLLVLDEPTSHLDIRAQLLVLDLLQRRARAGCTIVLALHDLNLAARYCDHLVVMADGTVVTEGTPNAVLTADLVRKVYRVSASIVRQPGSPYPIVVFDRAE